MRTLTQSKMKVPLKNPPPTEVENFLISVFKLKQGCDIAITQKCHIWNFSFTSLLIASIKYLRKVYDKR